jgi:predicted signal transduction protein with EAL and GGDEF domain
MGEGAAVERAELLRGAMEDTVVGFGATQISITASFGVATFPRQGRTSDELIAAADGALYVAKADGRNRVTVCLGHNESASMPGPGAGARCPRPLPAAARSGSAQ